MEIFFLFLVICEVFGAANSSIANWRCPTGTYISDNQCLPCPDNCLDCSNKDNCYVCKATYWGPIFAHCGLDCPKTCLYSECDEYFGHCKRCPPKHYGRLCETRLEILCADGLYPVNTDQGNFECRTCSKDCLRCDDYKCLSCRPGFYKHQLEADCQRCRPNCNRCTDKVCIECKDGRFGHYCEHKCTIANCEKCSFGLSNDIIVCQECKPEFILQNGKCYCPVTCTESCNTTGEECAGLCIDVSKNCKQCGKDNAEICLECNDGFYGNKCHWPCSRNCRNTANKNGTMCSRKDGTCNHGCYGGRYGPYCNFICPSYCSPQHCDQYNGTCLPEDNNTVANDFGKDEGKEKDISSIFYQIGLGVCALAVIAFIVCLVKRKYSSAIINQNITPSGVRGDNMAIFQQNDVTRPIDRQNDATRASNQQNEDEDSPYDYIDIDFFTNNSSDNSTYFSDGYLRPVGQRTRNVDLAYLTPVYRTEDTGYDEIQYQATDCQSGKRRTYLELSADSEEETTL